MESDYSISNIEDYSHLQVRNLSYLNELKIAHTVKNPEAVSKLLDLVWFLKLNTRLLEERFNENRISINELKSIIQRLPYRIIYEIRFIDFYKLKVDLPGQDLWIKIDLTDNYYSIKFKCREENNKYSISTNTMNTNFIVNFPCKF